jgi:hypothetical protein
VRATLASLLTTLVLAAPAAAAEPICHGQLAPPTPEQELENHIQFAMEMRAENGLRADEAWVRELIARGLPDSEAIIGPTTPAEERYMRIRDRLAVLNYNIGRRARHYIAEHRDVYGGTAIRDRFPRTPQLVVYVTRDTAKHERALERLVRFPRYFATAQVKYTYSHLARIARRIERDDKELLQAGIDIGHAFVDAGANRVRVTLATARTDYAEYLAAHYPLVVTELRASQIRELVCVEAGFFELGPDDRTLTVSWIPQDSYAKQETIEVTEFDDRVELGVVESQPTVVDTDGAGPSEFKRKVTLSRPLGARAVVDAGDRGYLRQIGPGPGGAPCRAAEIQAVRDGRLLTGLPVDDDHIRRLLRKHPYNPFTKAERRYLRQYNHLDNDPPIQRYLRRHRRDIAGFNAEGRFPGKPHLVVWVRRRLEFHRKHLGPDVEVRQSQLGDTDIYDLWDKIVRDAEDAGHIMGGYGDNGFYIEDVDTRGAEVVLRLRTRRTDALAYFRSLYGPAVNVIVNDPRWECTTTKY